MSKLSDYIDYQMLKNSNSEVYKVMDNKLASQTRTFIDMLERIKFDIEVRDVDKNQIITYINSCEEKLRKGE